MQVQVKCLMQENRGWLWLQTTILDYQPVLVAGEYPALQSNPASSIIMKGETTLSESLTS